MAARGKPRAEGSASGRHDYTGAQSLSFWQRYWKAQIEAQPPKVRAETIARMQRLISTTRHHSALHDLAVCYGLEGGGDDGVDN